MAKIEVFNRSKEALKNTINSFADDCATLLLAFGAPVLANLIAAGDMQLAQITLLGGEALAGASFVGARIKGAMARRRENNDFPKPKATENPASVTIVQFKPAGSII